MSLLGGLHLASALVALGLGAVVLLQAPKGTRRHRQLGYAWVATMFVLNVTALTIYRLFGGFGPFHVAALISLVSIAAALCSAIMARSARRKRDLVVRGRWVDRHYQLMSWSYIGLVAAAVSEVATRLPVARPGSGPGIMFGIAVAAGTVLVLAIGAWWVYSKRDAQLGAIGIKIKA